MILFCSGYVYVFSYWQYSDPILDILCVRQSDAAPFCETYAKLYFYARHLEKGLNEGWWNFWCPFWPKSDAAVIFKIRSWYCFTFFKFLLYITYSSLNYSYLSGAITQKCTENSSSENFAINYGASSSNVAGSSPENLL